VESSVWRLWYGFRVSGTRSLNIAQQQLKRLLPVVTADITVPGEPKKKRTRRKKTEKGIVLANGSSEPVAIIIK
jgi:hypothetical protein